MKEKDGFGNPNVTDLLQSLQTQLNLLKELNNILNSELRYKNSSDWRDWSVIDELGAQQVADAPRQDAQELVTVFQVSKQCQTRFLDRHCSEPVAGFICICGHPNVEHVDDGMCQAGSNICYCRRPRPALRVSDLRYFYRATKGPHEAHALVLGLGSLTQSGGSSSQEIPWVCNSPNCRQVQGVNPVRMRNANILSMGLSVHDKHKLMCEPCLFRALNGN